MCDYEVYGCDDPSADNYASYVTVPVASMCSFAGCNDTEAKNFDSDATFNDGSCVYYKYGCMVRNTRRSPRPAPSHTRKRARHACTCPS